MLKNRWEFKKTTNRKTIGLLACLFLMAAAFYISASTAFMVLLLGILFIPPVLMVVAALGQGASIMNESDSDMEKEPISI